MSASASVARLGALPHPLTPLIGREREAGSIAELLRSREVRLAPLSDPELVIATIAQAAGLRELGDRPLADVLAEFFRGKRLLLVLSVTLRRRSRR